MTWIDCPQCQISWIGKGRTGLFCNGCFCSDLDMKRAGVGCSSLRISDAILEPEGRLWYDPRRPLGITIEFDLIQF